MQIIPNSELVAVMRRNQEKAADYAHRHHVPRYYSEAQQLIDDPEVNAIYIATPPDAHLRLTFLALESGKPVYVEKPMARTYDECLKMVDASETFHQPLYVAYYRRALPNFLHIKSLIENGRIGTVRAVNITLIKALEPDGKSGDPNNWRVDPAIAGGGYFYDLASHQFDFLDFLFGPIVSAKGHAENQAKKYNAEDIVSASFRFEQDIVGTGLWSFNSAQCSECERITIIGSEGEIAFETFGDPSVILRTDRHGEEIFSFEYPKHIQHPLIASIVGDLLGEQICESYAVSACRTNWVMEQICSDGSS